MNAEQPRGHEARYRAIFDTAVDAIVVIDEFGIIEAFNPAAERMFGYNAADMVGKNVKVLMPEPYRREHDAYLANYRATGERKIIGIGREVEGQRQDGSLFPLDLSVAEWQAESGRHFTAIMRNISDRKLAEDSLRRLSESLSRRVEQLAVANQRLVLEIAAREQAQAAARHSQKMEVIGQLAGGVAHDFNNLLTIIVGRLQRSICALEHSPRLSKDISAALDAAERGASLTHKLLAFAHRQPLKPDILDLSEHLVDTTELLDRSLIGDVLVRLRLDAAAWPVRADANQLATAIMNIAVNARDAMPDGGTLTIEAHNVTRRGMESHGGDLAGDFVELTLTDTGVGMPPEVVEHVFEPFFTTKEAGNGTGLGLSQVYDFATQSGGIVEIRSTVGRGTTVALYLPAQRVDR